jgi:protein-tyrosine phosphatase
MQHLLEVEGLSKLITLDSAGTASYHAGEKADGRSRATAQNRGIELRSIARKIRIADFEEFDFLIAMDGENLANLQAMAPENSSAELFLFRDFDEGSAKGSEVPDPYYGGPDGFENVFDICEAAARGLLAHIRERGLV